MDYERSFVQLFSFIFMSNKGAQNIFLVNCIKLIKLKKKKKKNPSGV